MNVHRCPTSSFIALDAGKSIPLDLKPPQGHALGIQVHGGVVYVYQNPDVPVTDEDKVRWKEATEEEWQG